MGVFTSREAAGHVMVKVKKKSYLWVAYGFLATVASMFGDFQHFQMISTNYHLSQLMPLIFH